MLGPENIVYYIIIHLTHYKNRVNYFVICIHSVVINIRPVFVFE
jgi:lipoate-protein ligase B